MSGIYLYTLGSVFLVSLISLVGIFTLLLREDLLRKYIFLLVSLAIGALLGDAFIHLIPESFEVLPAASVGLLIIGGILLFFVLEKFLHWHHTHGISGAECEHEHGGHQTAVVGTVGSEPCGAIEPVGKMILVGDGVHNFLDGIIVAAGYFVSVEVGIATTLAVILHEIPQEIGDFGVLLHAGFTKARAVFLNFLSALLAVFGAVLALLLGSRIESAALWAVPLIAGAFIYIAASDLIPELHKTKHPGQSLLQIAAIIVGVLAMLALVFTEV